MAFIHSQQTISDGIHGNIANTYANETARLAAVAGDFATTDIYKEYFQLSDNTTWMLIDPTGPTWLERSTGGQSVETTIYTGDGTINGLSRDVNMTNGGSLNFDNFNTNSSTFTTRANVGISSVSSSMSARTGDGAGNITATSSFFVGTSAITFTDGINSKGAVYAGDYSTLGEADDRWIPDWAAVKGYADGVSIYATNGDLTADRTLDLRGFDLTVEDDVAATAATGTITFTGVPANGDTVTINGIVTHWVNTLNELNNRNEIARGSLVTATDAATVFESFLNASEPGDLIQYIIDSEPPVSGSRTGAVVTVTADDAGTAGNSIDTTLTGSAASWGAATMSGGLDNFVATFTPTAVTIHQPLSLEDTVDAQQDITMEFGRHVGWKVTSFPNDLWEIDASGGQQRLNFSYNDNGTPSNKVQFTEGGAVLATSLEVDTALADVDYRLPATVDTNDRWIIDVDGSDNFRLQYFDDSAATTSTQLTLGSTGGNLTVNQNLILGDGSQIRLPTALTANDQWRWDGGNSDDTLRFIYYDDDGGGNNLRFTMTPAGLLNYQSDLSGSYTDRTVTDKAYVDAKASDGSHDLFPAAFNKTGGGDLSPIPNGSANRATLPLNNEYLANSTNYSIASNQITFLNTGIYLITFDMIIEQLNDTGLARGSIFMQAFQGGGSGVGTQIHEACAYIREATDTMGISFCFFISITSANDTLEFDCYAQEDSGGTPPQVLQGSTMVNIIKAANV